MYAQWGKRFFDITLSLLSAILLSPIILIVTFLIKLFDCGPIFFVQDRIGRDSKEFKFFKFRSMPVGTPEVPSDQVKTIKMTWVGLLIRRTNLDELPQLYNIIRGDMSIVGPRPAIKNQTLLIELREMNGASKIRPGLTGFAQISSFDGMSTSKKAELDGEYCRNITLLGDLKIICSTFGYLLKRPPVY